MAEEQKQNAEKKLTRAERMAARLEQKTAKLVNPNIQAYVALHNVNKVYPDGIHAVHDFNIDIAKYEFIVLVGSSGCGKSTTLRMIAGLESITSGDLYIDKVYSNNLESRDRNIAMVFQNYALYPNMTIYDNIAFGMKMRGEDRATIDRKVREAANMLQLNDYLFKKPSQLSGGQKQRVALGRAIVRNAKLYLMDEPLSNLDAKLRVQTRAEIVRLHEAIGATTIYVTHDQTEAMTMADRIVCMSRGHVQQIGTPLEIYEHPANKFVATFIGSPSMNIMKAHYDHGHVTVGDRFAYELSEEERKTLKEFYKARILTLRERISKVDETVSMLPHFVDAIERRDEKLSAEREKLLNAKVQEHYRKLLSEGKETLTQEQREELEHALSTSLAITREALYSYDAQQITGATNLPLGTDVDPAIMEAAKAIDEQVNAKRAETNTETYTKYLQEDAKLYRRARRQAVKEKAEELAAKALTEDAKENPSNFIIANSASIIGDHKVSETPKLFEFLGKNPATGALNARWFTKALRCLIDDIYDADVAQIPSRVPTLIEEWEGAGHKKAVALTEEERSRALSNATVAKAVTRGTLSTLKFYQRFNPVAAGGNLKTRDQLKEELLAKYNADIATYQKYMSEDVFDLSFGIRPENMTLARLASNYQRPSAPLTIDVNVAELLGSEYFLHASYADIDLVAKVPLDPSVHDHAPCDLVFDLNTAHLFDDISNNCIF